MTDGQVYARLTALQARLAQPTPRPIQGQEAIKVATIGHHPYEGPGLCRTDLFGQTCGAHRDEHQLIDENDRAT